VGTKVLTVSQLTSQVKGVIENNYSSVWVSGEVTEYKKASSGHWYFTLKDAGARLPAAMFRGCNLRARCDLKDGMEIVARGGLEVYLPHGKYQLIVQEFIPKGQGALDIALQQLKKKLFEKGYFSPARKRPLPRYPGRIALVTSPTGAAVRDILEVLGRRWPATEVWVCPVRVQGDTAAGEIAAALALLARVGGVDVIILGRGGGGTEDLHAFNDERVADAIFRAAVPVVSAVGHEIDLTIADLVADVRALTPSEAAERAVPDRAELGKDLVDRALRLKQLLWGRLEHARGRLDDLADRRAFRRPLDRVQDLAQSVDGLGERLERGWNVRLEGLRQQLAAQAARLESLSPLNVLGRGYSLTRRVSDGLVVRVSNQLRPGDLLRTVVHDGQFTSRVEEIAPPVGK
jgi:exodeoxyribonuclease VII large subunit